MTIASRLFPPAIALAAEVSRTLSTAQPALLSVIILPPSFRISRSDILLLPYAFGINTGHHRPRLTGLDGTCHPVFQLLGAECNHAPAPTGTGDLRAERPRISRGKDHLCQLRVTNPEDFEKGVVHIHVPAQFPGIAEVVDCAHADTLDGIENRVNDPRETLLELRDLLHHPRGAVGDEGVPDHEMHVLWRQAPS